MTSKFRYRNKERVTRDAPTPVTIISARKTVRAEMETFLAYRPESWRYILGVFGDWYGWDEDVASFQREDFKSYAAHLEKFCPTNRKYWSPGAKKLSQHLTQFLRSTGRVVIVARNEQDATIAKATGVVPNTLVLTRADFPRLKK